MSVQEQIESAEFSEVEYCRFFSLLESPFGTDFDCSKFYPGGNRQNVLDDVLIRIFKRAPFVFVRGEPGAGKTALCRMVAHTLSDQLCLYANNSGRSRAISLEKQLAEGLLLSAPVSPAMDRIEDALLEQVALRGQVVIMLEGLRCLSAEHFQWLTKLQHDAAQAGGCITLVFLYGKDELDALAHELAGHMQGVLVLDSLTEYETFEFLNDHLRACGHPQADVFSRDTASLIARDAGGVLFHIVSLANATLRRAFRRNAHQPQTLDVPVTRPLDTDERTQRSATLSTARSTLVLGVIGGGIMMMLIWSLLGEYGGDAPIAADLAANQLGTSHVQVHPSD
ncbi:MAG TPA: hypothetical protein DD979_16915 [Gammaproteobacteria bacterium]|jgi:type II secretory pathway predicted ATPase ExeA|nr:hypothetical protein [Gammaproteobacteria bacterium]